MVGKRASLTLADEWGDEPPRTDEMIASIVMIMVGHTGW